MPISLYIHVPFCRSRCSYCVFNTYAGMETLIPDYLSALVREIEWMAESAGRLPVHTVYFGGGTPSMLSVGQVDRILAALAAQFNLDPGCEITLEANPSFLESGYLAALRSLGVNRLSFGAQSVHAADLSLFRRDHTWTDVVQAVATARQAGYDNLSLDLIYGAPGQTLGTWLQTLNEVVALQPEHLSLYSLSVEPGSMMHVWADQGIVELQEEGIVAAMYEAACGVLAVHGFIHYEISNWAHPGQVCRHNMQYWRSQPYLGVGAGASGYANGIRYTNVEHPRAYIQRMSSSSDFLPQRFPLSPAVQQDTVEMVEGQQAMAETMFLRLRLLQEGVNRDTFAARYGAPPESFYGSAINHLKSLGLLEQIGPMLRLTERAWLVSNAVLSYFV